MSCGGAPITATSSRATSHSAAPNALGYLYQCRWALYGLIRNGVDRPDCSLSIETYDDIAWESQEGLQELVGQSC